MSVRELSTYRTVMLAVNNLQCRHSLYNVQHSLLTGATAFRFPDTAILVSSTVGHGLQSIHSYCTQFCHNILAVWRPMPGIQGLDPGTETLLPEDCHTVRWRLPFLSNAPPTTDTPTTGNMYVYSERLSK
jgi:hypothetical protein